MKTVRCVCCRSEFTDAEIQNATSCPKCHDQGVPMAIANDVDVRINWHELRILVIWAENWEASRVVTEREEKQTTHQGSYTVAAIAKELMRFRPEGAPALRLFDEVRELQDVFPGTEMRSGDGTVLVPKVPGSDKAN